MTQIIELFFWVWLFFDKNWLSELNLFFFFFKCDSKNWTFFFFSNVTRRIESFSLRLNELNFFFVWLQALNFCFQNDSKNWTFFSICPKEIEPFFFLHMTQRIEFLYLTRNWTFFQFRLKELNFLRYDPDNWTFFLQTQRIELCLKNDFFSQNWTFLKKIRLTELNILLITTHRN